MSHPLRDEFRYFLDHKAELVRKYKGKYVVIKNGKVLGAYADELEAIKKTTETEQLGTFLVQLCEAGDESYTQTFHSRVSFAKH